MNVTSFGKSLLFGAVAAVAVVFAQHLFAPIFGSAAVLAMYLAGALVVYAGLLGVSLRERARNVLLAGGGAVFVLMLSSGFETLVIGLVAVLACVRSGLDPRRRGPRGFALEMLLGLSALIFAQAMASPGWLGMSTAIWSFALVQSLFFLVPCAGSRNAAGRAGEGDAFERARERLLHLLEEA